MCNRLLYIKQNYMKRVVLIREVWCDGQACFGCHTDSESNWCSVTYYPTLGDGDVAVAHGVSWVLTMCQSLFVIVLSHLVMFCWWWREKLSNLLKVTGTSVADQNQGSNPESLTPEPSLETTVDNSENQFCQLWNDFNLVNLFDCI